MKSKSALDTLSLLVLAAIASPLAMAADPTWYLGGNIGQSRPDLDEGRIANQVLGPGLAVTSSHDDRDTGAKLFGGYRFHRNFAIEGGYFDLGKVGFSATTIPAGTFTGSLRVKGLNLDTVGILPMGEKFSAFGRIGVTYARTRDTFSGTGAAIVLNPNPSERDWGYKLGLGLQYDFTPRFGARAEVERYRVNDAVGGYSNINLISVGLVYLFGAKTPAPAPRVETPAPVAQPYVAPPPPPVAAKPPPPAPPRQEVVTPPPPPPQQAPARIDRN